MTFYVSYTNYGNVDKRQVAPDKHSSAKSVCKAQNTCRRILWCFEHCFFKNFGPRMRECYVSCQAYAKTFEENLRFFETLYTILYCSLQPWWFMAVWSELIICAKKSIVHSTWYWRKVRNFIDSHSQLLFLLYNYWLITLRY